MIEGLHVGIPAGGAAGEFSSPESTFCAGSYSVSVILQWHVKDLGHSAKSVCGRFQLHAHTPLTQQVAVG